MNKTKFSKKEYQRKYQKEYRKKNQDRLNEYRREWRLKNLEDQLGKEKEYRQKNKEHLSEYNKNRRNDYIRKRERKYREASMENFLGHKFTQMKINKYKDRTNDEFYISITLPYILELWHKQDGKCAISGKQMLCKRNSLFTVSVDRIDSNYGYFEGNVQLVCQAINFAKNKYTDEEIRYFLGNDSANEN